METPTPKSSDGPRMELGGALDKKMSVSSHPVCGLDTPPPEEVVREEFFGLERIPSPIFKPQLRDSIVAVIGVGYVGFQLATTFAKAYRVLAFDISQKRLSEIIPQFKDLQVKCTHDPNDLASASHFLICVPTRLHHDNTVDTQHLCSAIELVATYAKAGATVVIESSVAVGMTRRLMKPIMCSKALKVGMSPERVDPGRVAPAFENIPKIISGLDDIVPGSLASIYDLYQPIFSQLVQVSSPEVAEMTKLYENCQRMVCIAYANEMADACRTIGINALEVSAAAATKPFGYQPYGSGLGVGGHCIPVNPYYLLSTAQFPLLRAATKRMAERPVSIGDRVMRKYFSQNATVIKSSRQSSRKNPRARVLVVGVGFKRGQSVLSNSPGVALIRHLLSQWEAYVEYVDPLVHQEDLPFVPKMDEASQWNSAALEEQFDIVIVAVNQVGLDPSVIQNLRKVMVENHTSAVDWCPGVST